MNPLHALLFPDWDLESLLQNVDPAREDDLSLAISAIQSGQMEEAEAWLTGEISRYPWVLMAAAYVKIRMNEPAEAGRLLRAVTLISSDVRLRLWAWYNLRQLGKYPSPDLARQVLGVVVEIPYEDRADVLAAYADGSARYINHQGGVIVWDRLDDIVTPLVMTVIRETQPAGEAREDHVEEPVGPEEVRVSILTPGGMHIWEGAPTENKSMTRLFAGMANLLRALVRAAMQNRNREEDVDDEDM